jgi:polysulfide reductase chain C
MQTRPWEFGVKAGSAREWSEGLGSLIAVAMFLGGIAGGLYLVSLYFNSIWGMLVAWIFAMGMGLFDMAHLSKPGRVWRIATRAGSSWISRGFIFVILFIGAAGIQLLIHLLTGASASEPTVIEVIFRAAAGILAFCVAIYSGFVLGFVNGVKFWSSALLPVLVVIGGLAGGAAVLLAITSFTSQNTFESIQTFTLLILAGYVISVFILLWVSTYSSPIAKDSAQLLLSGSLAIFFWILIILIGVVIPFLLILIATSGSQVLLILCAVCALLGNMGLRYALIKAGRYSPLVPS